MIAIPQKDIVSLKCSDDRLCCWSGGEHVNLIFLQYTTNGEQYVELKVVDADDFEYVSVYHDLNWRQVEYLYCWFLDHRYSDYNVDMGDDYFPSRKEIGF